MEPIKPLGCEVEADYYFISELYEPEHKYVVPNTLLYSPYHGTHCAPHLMYNAEFNFYSHPLQPQWNYSFKRFCMREPKTFMPNKQLPIVQELVSSGECRDLYFENEDYNLSYVRSFKLSQTLNDHTGCVNGVKMSDDGELLITCSDDLHICIYECGCNINEETSYYNYRQRKQNTSAPALSSSSFIRPESYPDHLSLLSQSYWQLRTRLATPHQSNIFHASFIIHDASHSHVLTCGNDGLTLLMDVEYNSIIYKVCAGEWACSIATSPWSPFVAYVAYGQGVIACIDTRLPSHSFAQLDHCNSTTPHHLNSVNSHVTPSKISSYRSWSNVIDVEPVILTPCAGIAQSINALAMHHMYPFTLALGTNSEYVFFADVRMGSGRSYAALTITDNDNNDDDDCYNTRLSTLPTDNSTSNRRSRGNIRHQAAHRSISFSDGISGLSFSERGDWLAVNYRSADIYLCPWVAQLRKSQINVATTHDPEKSNNLCDLEQKFNALCRSTHNNGRSKSKNMSFSRGNERHDISRVHGNASASEQNSNYTTESTWSKKIKHEQQEINTSASIIEHTPECNEPQAKFNKVHISKSSSNNMHHVPFVTSFPCNTNYHYSCSSSSLPLSSLESKTEKNNVGVSWLECCGGTFIPVVMSERKSVRQLTGRENVSTMFKEVIFMEDDRYVCSGGDDGNVYIWHAASGRLIAQWHADEDVVNGVLYHAQRRQLITCGIDSSTKVYAASFFGNEDLYSSDDENEEENEKMNTSSDDSMTKNQNDAISHNNDDKHFVGHVDDCLSSQIKITNKEEEEIKKVTSPVAVAAESTQDTTIADGNAYHKYKEEKTAIDSTFLNKEQNRTYSSSSSPPLPEIEKENNHSSQIANRHVCENNHNMAMMCINTRIETPRIIAMTSEQAIALRKHFRNGNLQHAVIASLYRQFNQTKCKSIEDDDDDDHAQEQLFMPQTFVLSLTNVLAARSSVMRIRERLFHGEYFVSLGDNILSMIINNFLGSNNITNVNSEVSSLEDENHEEYDLSSWEEVSNTDEEEHQLQEEEEEEDEQREPIETNNTISSNMPSEEEEEEQEEYNEQHEHGEENEEEEQQQQNESEHTINSHDHTTTTISANNNNNNNNSSYTRTDEVIVVQIQHRSSRGENRVQLIPIRHHRAHQTSSPSLSQLINPHDIQEERRESAPHGQSYNTSSSSSSSQDSDTSVELELEQFPNIAAFYAANNMNNNDGSGDNNEFDLNESHVKPSNDRYDGNPGKDDFVQFRANSWNKLTESVAQMQEMISALIANWVIRKENNGVTSYFTNKESIVTSTTEDDVDKSHVCCSRYAKRNKKSKTRKCTAVTRKNAKQKNESIKKKKMKLEKLEKTINKYGKFGYHHIRYDKEQVQICEWNRCLFAHYTNDIDELQGKHNNKLIPTDSRLLLDNVREDIIRLHMNEAHETSSAVTTSNIENTGDEGVELAGEVEQTRIMYDSNDNNDNNNSGMDHNESSENEIDVSNNRNRRFANEHNEMETTFREIEQEINLSSSLSSSSSSTEPNMYALLSEEDLQHIHTTGQNTHINNNINNSNNNDNDNDNYTNHSNSHVDNIEHTKSLSNHQLNAMMLYYLLHVLDILLQGRDAFTCSAEERRVYWEWRKWLEFHYIYLFMAVGNVESALRHCAHLDDWFEFADCVELGGCTLAQAIECVHRHNTYSLDSSSFQVHSSVNITDNNNNNNIINNDVDSIHNESNCKINSLNMEAEYNEQLQDTTNQISNRKNYDIKLRHDNEQTEIKSRKRNYKSTVKKCTRGKSTKNTNKINNECYNNVVNSNKLFNKSEKFTPEIENCRKGQNDNLETDILHNVTNQRLFQNTTNTTCKTNASPFHPLRYTTWRFVPPVYHDQTMMEMVNVTREVMPKGSNGTRGALSQEIVLPSHNAKVKRSSIPRWKSTKASNNKNYNGDDNEKKKKRKQLQTSKLVKETKLSRNITSTVQRTKLERARKSTSKKMTEKYKTIKNNTEPLNTFCIEEEEYEEEEHLNVRGHPTYFPKLLIPLALQVRILHLAITWLRRTLLTMTMNEVHTYGTTTNDERYENCNNHSIVNENITNINDDIDRYKECLQCSLVELKNRLEMHPNTEVCAKEITMLRELDIDVEHEEESVENTEGEEKLPTLKRILLNKNIRNK